MWAYMTAVHRQSLKQSNGYDIYVSVDFFLNLVLNQ